MNLSKHLEVRVGGFSGHRVAHMLAVISFAFVPIHYYVSCEGSAATGCVGVLLFLLASLLSFLTQRGTPHRFRPLGLAFAALVLHMLSTH
jgi:hypothetical protein